MKMTITEKHNRTAEIYKKYLAEHPEANNFILAMKKIYDLYLDSNKSVDVTVSVGKTYKSHFCPYLTSSFENPKICFSFYKCVPILYIKNKYTTIAAFYLNDISVENTNVEDCSSFVRYSIYLKDIPNNKEFIKDNEYHLNFIIK